jgi:hypothetical protein
MTPLEDRVVEEGEPLRVAVRARDPLGDPIALRAERAGGGAVEVLGASFRDLGGGKGALHWTPSYEQSGSYAVTFSATTSARLETSETIRIEVLDVNRPPVAVAGRDLLTRLGESALLDGCSSFDPEGAPLSFEWTDGAGNEVGTSCELLRESPPLPRLERFTLTVSDGVHLDSDRVRILWLPRFPFDRWSRWLGRGGGRAGTP